MRRLLVLTAAVGLGLFVATGAWACGIHPDALKAASLEPGDPALPALVEALRARGPQSLEDLFLLREMILRQQSAGGKLPAASPDPADSRHERIARINEIIDQVGKQRYCWLSRLYWHTDFDQALAAAQKSGRPILSLRMLGNLDEDFSCANSRFFRATLYANQEIAEVLRSNFVLHWKSVRPVPKVTIDFGDGRKLERTLTGNSIHYVLTPDGEVVEALPGLYGPKAFLQKISAGASLARQVGALAGPQRQQALQTYHTAAFSRLGEEWNRDMEQINKTAGPRGIEAIRAALANPQPVAEQRAADPPPANEAAKIAVPKMRAEFRLIAAALPMAATPEQIDDERTWNAVAALHADDSKVDAVSRELIRSQNPTAAVAGRLAITKRVVEDPLVRLVNSLESSIALDTVRNEYRLHRQIHAWYMAGRYRPHIDELNERVYAQLFLTPSSDPWLGLAPVDVYTALPNAGVVQSR